MLVLNPYLVEMWVEGEFLSTFYLDFFNDRVEEFRCFVIDSKLIEFYIVDPASSSLDF